MKSYKKVEPTYTAKKITEQKEIDDLRKSQLFQLNLKPEIGDWLVVEKWSDREICKIYDAVTFRFVFEEVV